MSADFGWASFGSCFYIETNDCINKDYKDNLFYKNHQLKEFLITKDIFGFCIKVF